MENNKKYSALDIARFFIRISSKNKIDDKVVEGITNLKLQKILYFAEAAHLTVFGKELFSEEIQAWPYGPVVPRVYNAYKKHGASPIVAEDFSEEIKDKKVAELLKAVWIFFGKYSAFELMDITHKHKPWKDAIKDGPFTVIKKGEIKSYYKDLLKFKST